MTMEGFERPERSRHRVIAGIRQLCGVNFFMRPRAPGNDVESMSVVPAED
jgi:hypothetical protein